MENYINFLLNIKLNSLRRNHLDSLTYKQLRRVIFETKWLLGVPKSLSEIAKDIDSLTIEEVAKYLTYNDSHIQKQVEDMTKQFEEDFSDENLFESEDNNC